jgi:hypothetical protein
MPRKSGIKLDSSRVLDYPACLSEYERESLAAEAKLKAERKKQKPPKPRGTKERASKSPAIG